MLCLTSKLDALVNMFDAEVGTEYNRILVRLSYRTKWTVHVHSFLTPSTLVILTQHGYVGVFCSPDPH